MAISTDFRYLEKFVTMEDLSAVAARVLAAQGILNMQLGVGSAYLGWLKPESILAPEELERLLDCAKRLCETSDVVLVAGIGGSYLGAKAAIDWLVSPNYNLMRKNTPELHFVGNDISPTHLKEVFSRCEGKRVSVIVISKSGSTTETALAFRVIRQHLRKTYSPEELSSRVVAITDEENGTLRAMAQAQGYDTFAIPSNIGGRYSVFTAVGLLPMAVAGIDCKALLAGAAQASSVLASSDFGSNPALLYAAARYALYNKGLSVELFCGWDPAMTMTLEWLKQLFGESEGKQHRGIFPASATYTTDLHSLGQFVQEGSKILFETMISVDDDLADIVVAAEEPDVDELNFLAGKSYAQIAESARQAVCTAHYEGDTPIIDIKIPSRTPFEYGWALYFFQYTCGVAGYALGVNPFDQPGVEAYKTNMFGLLGKPGYNKPKLM